jgi:predicted dehydrogenase
MIRRGAAAPREARGGRVVAGSVTAPPRVGILGAARIAERAIVKPAHATGTRLVTVAARDRRRAEAYAAEHGIEKATDSYRAVVDDPDVEVVYNPLPNALHGPWNLAAVEAGKHVLSEKPFASTAEEAAEVRDAAQKAGVTVVEGFHYGPAHRASTSGWRRTCASRRARRASSGRAWCTRPAR